MLLRLGLRGRRIDDHPLCKRCRFDLVGIYPRAERCTECGRELADRTIRIGHRKPIRSLAAMGLLVTSAGAVALAGVVFLLVSGTGWNDRKPTWLLVGEARVLGTTRAGPALTELLTRFNTGNLDDETMKELVSVALDRQADRSRPWTPEWGDVVEAADANGLLDHAQLNTYVMNASPLGMNVRPSIRYGDRLPVVVTAPNQRAGSSTQFWIALNVATLEIDGERVGFPTVLPFAGGVMISSRQNTGFEWPAILVPIPTDLEPGEHTVRVEWQGSYIGLGGGTVAASFAMLPETFKTTTTFVVLPEGEDTIELVNDHELVEQFERAHPTIRVVDYGFEQDVTVSVNVNTKAEDLELVYDVYIRRQDGKRLRIDKGDVHVTEAVLNHTGIWASRAVRSLPDEPFDVILVVSADRARATIDTQRILGREFVYEDIQPERQFVEVEQPSIDVAPMRPNPAAFETFLENAAAMNAAKELEESDD